MSRKIRNAALFSILAISLASTACRDLSGPAQSDDISAPSFTQGQGEDN